MRMSRRELIFGIPLLLCALGAGFQWGMTRWEAQRFPAPGRMVDIGGRRLHLLCAGAGAPTVILEPSGLGSVLQYAAVQSALAKDQRVCAYDRAGQGWSDPSPDPADALHLSADLAALLSRSGAPAPYLLVASSAGGITVDMYARQHLDQVAGLVFLDALTGEVAHSLPGIDRVTAAACRARTASWFGLPRLLDPLGLRDLPPGERARAIAMTYRTSTLQTACSIMKSIEDSYWQIAKTQPFPQPLPLVVLTHDDPAGIVPGLDDGKELAEFEMFWQMLQQGVAHQKGYGEYRRVHSRHLIATENPDAVIEVVRRLSRIYRAAGSA